ncbi:hypothetical protein [Patulibacter sp. SYSU D01012]|uniref:hypothetical protein n=1 Tax=Patulibacter sp. SYSU D01012 TaxID=2817381 RepID=UPI001B301891|nr:hypothetical protein [Patulibacter sp. SYSU D01012]
MVPAAVRPRLLAPLLLAAALAATGCGGDDEAPSASAARGAATADGRPPDGGGAVAPAAWAGGGDDRGAVARRRVAGAQPADARDRRVTVDLTIRSLVVRGRTATLRVAAVPHGWGDAEAATGGAPTLWDLNPGPSTAGVAAQLIDVEHLRRHLPLEDSEGESVATMNYAGKVPDGQAIEASWVFAAPPADVRTMDVQVGNWPIFREIPVVRR